MKINIELNRKSIEDAKKKLLAVQKKLKDGTIMREYINECCKWIVERAKYYVTNSDIGENIKQDINSHWKIRFISENNAVIENDSDHAVYVEFGVGLMGQMIPHDNANEAGYRYNLPSAHKNGDYWVYSVQNEADVDMHPGYKSVIDEKTGRTWIITKGSWRVMYAYQAIVDAKEELRKKNGEFAKMWNKILLRYIG